ncbi:epididymal sperm-binding protein 1 isoform X2 [Anolis carolinensis]|uniref:epididymal sperm-binding protein 1 isoform X2 n=1 Tax=Anolis carolinensis TaxID=28377 RepID=UPI0007DB7AC5|nr:PREDICTED: epididymal sperm-binding protein 1 isoform X2 [Anolis carolinensis]|eukprot:XP_016851303.1 PREDICTED: epididymal sperm-binding protein 1 isoform X2 [Anolis carolinensis]
MVSIVISLLCCWAFLPLLRVNGEFRGNDSCVFPFAYWGQTYFTCTNKNEQNGSFWCATTGSYDKNSQWNYCTEVDRNSHGPCVFPFIYNGTIYSSCTTAGSSTGKLWCSLTSNYDENPKWTYCTPSEYEGTSHGQPCFFPFIYKGRTFFTCTNENEHEENGRFWCATSGSYDKEKKWSYCADTRLDINPTGPCVFPFIYGGKSYSTCTTDGPSLGMFWCSLTSNYDEDPKWTYCKFSEQRPCVFPFIYNGEPYSTCTRKGSADNLLWCATTANYDRDTKWKTCSMQEYEGSSKGKPCIFPFIYRKRSFYTCTNEYSEDRRFWCATTRNYDKDMQWSYCADTRIDANSIGTCVFPFIYKGQNYSSCTSAGIYNSKRWCSLTSNYDVDPRWAYCTY